MRTSFSGPSRISETVAVSIATLAALALLAYVLAYWTWAWLAPGGELRAQPSALATPRIDSASDLFGGSERGATASTASALTLLGVAAASGGKPGHAVLRIEGRQTVVVREGQEITPGVKLAGVHADRVELEQNGARQTLAWPVGDRSAPAPAAKKP